MPAMFQLLAPFSLEITIPVALKNAGCGETHHLLQEHWLGEA
jgi:hypothetical protein